MDGWYMCFEMMQAKIYPECKAKPLERIQRSLYTDKNGQTAEKETNKIHRNTFQPYVSTAYVL